MTNAQDTKAYWKRRALRAEMEVESYKRIRQADHSMEISMICDNSAMRQALREIAESLDTVMKYPQIGDEI